MGLYQVDKLMEETRRLASEYRVTTGQTLPVSGELAKYDGIRLLKLRSNEQAVPGVDAYMDADGDELAIQIKGRVIFDEAKSGHRLGQLNLDDNWDVLILVLMNEQYQTFEIYQMDHQQVEEALNNDNSSQRNRRGAMSVAKFKILSTLVWTIENGLEAKAK